jgi:hypothetical protein
VLGPGIPDEDRPETILHQFADAEIDILRRHVGRVDLATLVKIDVVGVGQRKAVGGLIQVDVEEDLPRAAAKLLGVHAHLMGHALLL